MSLPMKLPIGTILLHEGRAIRFEGELGDGLLRFTDVRTAGPVQVETSPGGTPSCPDIAWVRRELLAGRLIKASIPQSCSIEHEGELARCDSAACEEIDPKSAWRRDWTIAAHGADLKKTDSEYAAFIARQHDSPSLNHPDWGSPSAPTLRKWVRGMPDEYAPGHYISRAGRPKGFSPLKPGADSLVYEAALYYWGDKRASCKDAFELMRDNWTKLQQASPALAGKTLPTYETVRLRINSLVSYSTVAAKFGRERAEKMFGAVGNAIPTTRVLERVFIDGVELEQVCVFGEDWQLPGSKMKCVFTMDHYSGYVFPPAVFAGPYREEESILALSRAMMPPEDVTAEELAEDEFNGWCWGIIETLVPDNDRTLVPPGYIPGLLQLGTTVALPGTYHHDAKQSLEGFHRWLKSRLRGLPGTVLSPRHPKDIKQDPVNGAELTHRQLNAIIHDLLWEHNHTPKAHLNHRSPFEIFKASARAHGAATLDDPQRIRSELGKTVTNKVLTDDGVEHDGIQYRGPEVRGLLERNYRQTPAKQQIEGSAKCLVTIRTFEGDIDSIKVFDKEAKTFVTLLSTQPSYTAGLSRWEHNHYSRLARERREKFDTEHQRVNSRVRSLRSFDREAPKTAFRRRAVMMALHQCEDVRRMSGAFAKRQISASLPEHFVSTELLTAIGQDAGAPPPGPKVVATGIPHKHQAPRRSQDYGRASANLRHETHDEGGSAGALNWDELAGQVLTDEMLDSHLDGRGEEDDDA